VGAWGTGLYDDDTTCDVRDQWLEKLNSGTPAEAATAELIAAWGGAAAEPLFWLALADTQRRWGRLEPEVRQGAERALAAGGGLELWSDSPPKARAARKRVLERLAVQLRHPPLPPRPVRVQSEAIAWARGQLWAYQMLDGRHAVLRVAAFDPACGLVGAPVTELLDVALDELPPSRPLADATLRPARRSHIEGRVDFLAPEHRVSPMFEPKVKQRGELPRARLKKLRAAGEPRPATAETRTFGVAWSAFDQFLANMFDLGAPRLGTIHGWQTPEGGRRYTVLEWMEWSSDTVPNWQLGVLDDSDPTSAGLAVAPVRCSVLVRGFLPATLEAVGHRTPANPVPAASGAVHDWAAVPALLGNPEKLVAVSRAFSALLARPRKSRGGAGG